jgi:hypothetical protein
LTDRWSLVNKSALFISSRFFLRKLPVAVPLSPSGPSISGTYASRSSHLNLRGFRASTICTISCERSRTRQSCRHTSMFRSNGVSKSSFSSANLSYARDVRLCAGGELRKCDALTPQDSFASPRRRLVLGARAEQGLGPWSTAVCSRSQCLGIIHVSNDTHLRGTRSLSLFSRCWLSASVSSWALNKRGLSGDDADGAWMTLTFCLSTLRAHQIHF